MKVKALFIGRTTIDLIFRIQKLPDSNTKIKGDEFLTAGGGPALNAAVAFSAISETNPDLFTIIGSSSTTDIVKNDLKEHNVNFFDFKPDEDTLATSSIFVENNGNRTIIGSPIKNIKIESKIDLNFSKEYDIVLWDGYYPTIFKTFMKKNKNKNIKVILDADRFHPHLEEYYNDIDILIAGDTFSVPDEDLLPYLKKHFKKFAITNGEKDITIYENKKISFLPVEKITPIDTLGAGDFFHGSFCYYYIANNLNFREALRLSSKVSALSCQNFGSRSWIKKTHLL